MLGWLVLGIWIYLLSGRGFFWRVREEPPPAGAFPTPPVAVVIPARNEADVIGKAIESLTTQSYRGRIDVIVVDDHSTDGTANAAHAAGPGVTIVSADLLPPGWTGKLWALACGIQHATTLAPAYYLFTDADIVHHRDNVADLVTRAESFELDLVSLMVKLRCVSFAERTLIPAFLFFFLKLYPPAWRRGAAGGCILIRPAALKRIGGLDAIRGELIDDCALAREIGRSGSIWMGVTTKSHSIRAYDTFEQIAAMISRTAFTQLRHSWLMLSGTLLGLVITYLAPPVLAILGNMWGLAAWILMTIAYLPTLRLYRMPRIWALALPAVALFYMGATVQSAIGYWRGHGGVWKGRVQGRTL